MYLKQQRVFFKVFTFLLAVCYLNPLGGANKLFEVDDADLYEYLDEGSGSGDSFDGSGNWVAPPSPSEDLKVPPPGGRGPKAFGSGPTIPVTSNNTETPPAPPPSASESKEENYSVDSEEEIGFPSEEIDSDFSFATPLDESKLDDELFSVLTSTSSSSEVAPVDPLLPTTKLGEKVTPVDTVTLPVESGEVSEFDIVKGACIAGIAVLILVALTCVLCRCVKKRRAQRRIRDKKTESMIKNGNTEKSDSFRFTSPARRTTSTTQTEPVPVVVTRLPDVAATAAAANSKFLHVDDLMPRTFTSFTPSAPVYGETTIPLSEVDKLLDDTQRQLEELERQSNDRPKYEFMKLRETSLDEPDGASRNSVEFDEKEEEEIIKEMDSFLDNLGPRYR